MIFTSKSSLLIQTHIQASGWALNYSTRCFQTCLVHTVLTASHRFSAPHPWWEFPISPDAPLDWQPEAVQAIECSEFTVTVKKSVLNDLVLWHLVFVLLSEDAHTDHRRMDVSNNSPLGCGVQTIRARASPPPLTADRSGSMPTSLIYSWDFTNIFKCDEYNETNKIQIRLWKITATFHNYYKYYICVELLSLKMFNKQKSGGRKCRQRPKDTVCSLHIFTDSVTFRLTERNC